ASWARSTPPEPRCSVGRVVRQALERPQRLLEGAGFLGLEGARKARNVARQRRLRLGHAEGLLDQVQDDVVDRPAAVAGEALDALCDGGVDVADEEIRHGMQAAGTRFAGAGPLTVRLFPTLAR